MRDSLSWYGLSSAESRRGVKEEKDEGGRMKDENEEKPREGALGEVWKLVVEGG